MKIEKTIGVVTLIAILLLSVATTLGNFSPISHAQVDGETDLGQYKMEQMMEVVLTSRQI